MKKKFSNFFYQIDLFKIPFYLFVKNRKKSSTCIGSFLTLFLLSLILYSIFTSRLYLKIRPSVLNQTIAQSFSPEIELTHKNFQISVGLVNNIGKAFFDPTIFSITFIQKNILLDEDNDDLVSEKIFNSIECSKSSYFEKDSDHSFTTKNYFCPEFDSIQLKGGFSEKNIQYFSIDISPCVNETKNYTCKPQDEIQEFLKDKRVWIYIQDYVYNIYQYLEPITKNWRLQTLPILKNPQEYSYYLKKFTLITDENIFYDEFVEQDSFIRDYMEITNFFKPSKKSYSASLNIYSSQNVQKIQRNYEKVSNLIGKIGGLMNLFIFISYILTQFQSNLQVLNYLISNLYVYKSNKEENIGKKKVSFPGKKKFK